MPKIVKLVHVYSSYRRLNSGNFFETRCTSYRGLRERVTMYFLYFEIIFITFFVFFSFLQFSFLLFYGGQFNGLLWPFW